MPDNNKQTFEQGLAEMGCALLDKRMSLNGDVDYEIKITNFNFKATIEMAEIKSEMYNRSLSRGNSAIKRPKLKLHGNKLLARGSDYTVFCALCFLYGKKPR